jgi:hypothetical protein
MRGEVSYAVANCREAKNFGANSNANLLAAISGSASRRWDSGKYLSIASIDADSYLFYLKRKIGWFEVTDEIGFPRLEGVTRAYCDN